MSEKTIAGMWEDMGAGEIGEPLRVDRASEVPPFLTATGQFSGATVEIQGSDGLHGPWLKSELNSRTTPGVFATHRNAPLRRGHWFLRPAVMGGDAATRISIHSHPIQWKKADLAHADMAANGFTWDPRGFWVGP